MWLEFYSIIQITFSQIFQVLVCTLDIICNYIFYERNVFCTYHLLQCMTFHIFSWCLVIVIHFTGYDGARILPVFIPGCCGGVGASRPLALLAGRCAPDAHGQGSLQAAVWSSQAEAEAAAATCSQSIVQTSWVWQFYYAKLPRKKCLHKFTKRLYIIDGLMTY